MIPGEDLELVCAQLLPPVASVGAAVENSTLHQCNVLDNILKLIHPSEIKMNSHCFHSSHSLKNTSLAPLVAIGFSFNFSFEQNVKKQQGQNFGEDVLVLSVGGID